MNIDLASIIVNTTLSCGIVDRGGCCVTRIGISFGEGYY